jgi:hypothetical protein
LQQIGDGVDLNQATPSAVGNGLRGDTLMVATHEATCRTGLLFRSNGSVPFTLHVEICEDIWLSLPSTRAATAEAQLLLNLSASNITISKVAIGICSAPAILPADDRS